nr:ATP-binding protein [uncultured Pseudomonas sp.]
MLATDDALYFPKALSVSDPRAVLTFCSGLLSAPEDAVTDASDLTFIDPFGLAMLRATLESRELTNVRFMPENIRAYLARMEFFAGLEVEGIDTRPDREPQTNPEHCVELVRISAGNSEEIASRLIHVMTGIGPLDTIDASLDADRRPIEYALKELLENSLSHAKKDGNGSASVWVACQHFATNDHVRIAIVDNGCGFLATLHNHAALQERSHLGAIKAALMERVSCNRGPHVGYETDSQNQGVGLTTTARIAEATAGMFVVASGDAWVVTTSNVEEVMTGCSWKGVAIAFTCLRSELHRINISELLPKTEAVADADISFE